MEPIPAQAPVDPAHAVPPEHIAAIAAAVAAAVGRRGVAIVRSIRPWGPAASGHGASWMLTEYVPPRAAPDPEGWSPRWGPAAG